MGAGYQGTVVVWCRGHPNVQLLHETTLEATGEPRLTPRGDCIACVSARVHVEGRCEGLARGLIVALNPWLGVREVQFTGVACDCSKPVIRRSGTCSGCIACRASVSARDLSHLRQLLSSPFTRVVLVVSFYAASEDQH